MKKSVIIFIGIGMALALVLVGIFGVAPLFQDQKVPVTSIKIIHEDMYLDDEGNNVIEIDLAEKNTVDLEWEITPDDATNKDVVFDDQNPDSEITISEIVGGNTATLTIANETIELITIKALDDSGKSDSVLIVALRNTTVGIGYNFAQNSIEPVAGDYDFEEGKLILFNGKKYAFNFPGDIEIEGETNVIDLVDSFMTINSVGTFTLKFTVEGTTKLLTVEVVDYLLGFGFDRGYQNYSNAIKLEATTYLDKEQLYEVGSGNVFKSTLLVKDRYNQTINKFEKTLILEEYNGAEYVLVDDISIYLSETVDNSIWFNFTAAAVGKNLRLTIVPKYSAVTSKTMEFIVNDGVNVYTHSELDDAFEMKGSYDGITVSKINIHNNIEIIVGEDQLYTEGPREGNLVNEDSYVGGTGVDAGKTGHIYYRHPSANENISVSVVGNYQLIDGGNIPMIVNSTGEEDLAPSGKHINVQSSIFRFGGNADSSFSIKNLKVVGNTRTAAGVEGTNLSGGVILVHVCTPNVSTVENLHLSDGVIGVFLTDYNGLHNYIRKTTIKDTYNSGVLLWGGHVELYTSKISNTGGPAVQVLDSNAKFATVDELQWDPSLVIDEYTLDNIENWIVGDEGWYMGMGVNLLVGQMKSDLNLAVGEPPMNKTLIKEEGSISTVNFKIFIQNSNPASSTVPTQGKIFIVPNEGVSGVSFERPHNYYTNFPGYIYVAAADANPYNFENKHAEIVTAVPATGAQVSIFIEWMDK